MKYVYAKLWFVLFVITNDDQEIYTIYDKQKLTDKLATLSNAYIVFFREVGCLSCSRNLTVVIMNLFNKVLGYTLSAIRKPSSKFPYVDKFKLQSTEGSFMGKFPNFSVIKKGHNSQYIYFF